uniref:LOW QUALITY PROTEIN: serpin-ZXA n=1 Tax=Nicotiana sylvestris TaxID=4096 RepID=A0A1U7WCF7_NICSY|nr:PREDICTED: LOW QUALITY PROTEIN: serpin-ZXA [Nicotiana sylvestris]
MGKESYFWLNTEVNKWAEEKTNCLIKEILPPGAVDREHRSSWPMHYISKELAWYEKFSASDTKDDEFHLLNEGSVQAPFMTSQKKQYVEAFDGFKALKLPYEQGYDRKRCFSMYLFLPNARDGLITNVTGQN